MTNATHSFRRTKLRLITSCLAICAGSMTLAACSDEQDASSVTEQSVSRAQELAEQQITLREKLDSDPGNYDMRLQSGDLAIRLGNYDRAIAEYKLIPEDSPQGSEALARLANAYLMNGNIRMASRAIDASDSGSPIAETVRVQTFTAKGENREAMAALQRGLKNHPNSPDLLAISAELEWMAGNNKEAQALIKRALASDADHPATHTLAGRIAMQSKNADLARKHFMKALDYNPNQQTAMLALAALARDEGDQKTATDWINRTNSAGKPNPIAIYFAAHMAYDRDDIEGAHNMLQPIRKASRDIPAIERLDALVQARRGQTETAIDGLQRYLGRGRSDFEARTVLAQLYIKAQQNDKAWETLRPELSRAQLPLPTLMLANDLAKKLGKPEAAALAQRVNESKQFAAIQKPMIEAGQAIREGDWAKADKIYAPLLGGKGGSNPVLLNNAANVKLQLGQHEAAMQLASRALAAAPNDPGVLDTMGWVMYKGGGSKAEARAYIERAFRASPGDSEIRRHYSEVSSGDSQGA